MASALASFGADEKRLSTKVSLVFALYFAPEPATDPVGEVARLLADPGRRLQLHGGAAVKGAVATLTPRLLPIEDLPLLKESSFQYFAVGLDLSDREKMAPARRLFLLEFDVARNGALVANREACRLLADLAEATHAAIWDDETRQLYSQKRWRMARVESWQGGIPLMSAHVTMHAYRDPELIRTITLGMKKFGLPDLVVDKVGGEGSRAAGNTLNALMQRLVEGGRLSDSGQLRLEFAALRHAKAREAALMNPGDGAKGAALLSLHPVAREEGDPVNTLLAIDFPEAAFATATEREQWGFRELFGRFESMRQIRAKDEAMADAVRKSRQKFFAQEARFRRGFAPGERLLVKNGFAAGDRTEFMWVEVVRFGDKSLEGLLANDPSWVKDLRAGMPLTVTFDEITDYIFYKADGTEEGNETGKVLDERGE